MNIYGCVRVFNKATGRYLGLWRLPAAAPTGISITPSGEVMVCDGTQVYWYDAQQTLTRQLSLWRAGSPGWQYFPRGGTENDQGHVALVLEYQGSDTLYSRSLRTFSVWRANTSDADDALGWLWNGDWLDPNSSLPNNGGFYGSSVLHHSARGGLWFAFNSGWVTDITTLARIVEVPSGVVPYGTVDARNATLPVVDFDVDHRDENAHWLLLMTGPAETLPTAFIARAQVSTAGPYSYSGRVQYPIQIPAFYGGKYTNWRLYPWKIAHDKDTDQVYVLNGKYFDCYSSAGVFVVRGEENILYSPRDITTDTKYAYITDLCYESDPPGIRSDTSYLLSTVDDIAFGFRHYFYTDGVTISHRHGLIGKQPGPTVHTVGLGSKLDAEVLLNGVLSLTINDGATKRTLLSYTNGRTWVTP